MKQTKSLFFYSTSLTLTNSYVLLYIYNTPRVPAARARPWQTTITNYFFKQMSDESNNLSKCTVSNRASSPHTCRINHTASNNTELYFPHNHFCSGSGYKTMYLPPWKWYLLHLGHPNLLLTSSLRSSANKIPFLASFLRSSAKKHLVDLGAIKYHFTGRYIYS